MRRDEYDVNEDGGEEFAAAWMIPSMISVCDGYMMKGEEKRGKIAACAIVFCKRSCVKCAKQW